MLEVVAKRWAVFVSRDTRSMAPSIVCVATGLAFILLHLFAVVSSEVLLGLGLLVVFVGLHLFERSGLLMLMDERQLSSSSPQKQRQRTENQDTHDFPG